jgi:hypothetical protein
MDKGVVPVNVRALLDSDRSTTHVMQQLHAQLLPSEVAIIQPVLDQLLSQQRQGTPLVTPRYEDGDVYPVIEPALEAIRRTLLEEERCERNLPEIAIEVFEPHRSLSASLIILTHYLPSTVAGNTIRAPDNYGYS